MTGATREIVQVPVLVVGTGPAGTTAALSLASLGVKSLVISRHRGVDITPRAHIINQRGMETFRDLGIEEELSKLCSDHDKMMHTSWSNSLAGEEFGRLFSWGNGPDSLSKYVAASPSHMSDLPQSYMEPAINEEAQKRGAEYRFATEWVQSVELEDGSYETILKHRFTGDETLVKSQFIVAGDGAKSQIVEWLNIPVDGKKLNTAFNVHIKADLTKYMVNRPGALNWVLNADSEGWSSVGNFRMVRPWNEWVVSMHPKLPDGNAPPSEQEQDDFFPTEEAVTKRLHQLIGDDTVPIEIISLRKWNINQQVARYWTKGNVACVGDAVHRHPPINGLGANTCIGDGYNVGWKIAYAVKGYASPSILSSLSDERVAVGAEVVKRANDGMLDQRRLWSVVGLTKEERKFALAELESATEEGKVRRELLAQAIEKTMDEHNSIGLQMNQIYSKSPLNVIEKDDIAPDFGDLNRWRNVYVSTYPGYHLPHVWVGVNSQTPRLSTLDICGKGQFTLLTGIGGEPWLEAVKSLNAKGFPMIRGHSIGFRQEYLDLYRDWAKVRGVDEDGAILVRPDIWVCWRIKGKVANPEEKLVEVLSKVLQKKLTLE